MRKNKVTVLLAAVLLALPSIILNAQENQESRFTFEEKVWAQKDPKFFQIDPDSIKLELIKEEEAKDMSYIAQTTLDEFLAKDDDPLVIIEKIINIAQKIWGIIKDNAPVVSINTKYATAVPKGIESWTDLSNWKKPKVYTYGFYASNLYGITVIHVRYKVVYTYGGDYKGKGKYLTGVTIVPEKTNVAWGYRFDMSAEVPDTTVTNVGSYSNPLAALQLKLGWTIASVLKETRGTSIYYIQGDGYMNEIASPFKVEIEDVESAAPLLGPADEIFE